MIPSDRRSSSSQKDHDSANRRYDTLANVDDFHSTVSSERSFYSPKKCAYLFGLLLKQEITDIDKYLRAVPRYRRYNNYFPQFACWLYFCRLRRMAVQFPLCQFLGFVVSFWAKISVNILALTAVNRFFCSQTSPVFSSFLKKENYFINYFRRFTNFLGFLSSYICHTYIVRMEPILPIVFAIRK